MGLLLKRASGVAAEVSEEPQFMGLLDSRCYRRNPDHKDKFPFPKCILIICTCPILIVPMRVKQNLVRTQPTDHLKRARLRIGRRSLFVTKALGYRDDILAEPAMRWLIIKPARPNHRGLKCWR
jgi:hypothetical protein